MNLAGSQTAENLMRTYALECQTRSRYTLFADALRGQRLIVLSRLMEDVSAQEAAHAEQFLRALGPLGGADVPVHGQFASALPPEPLSMLRLAQSLEFDEYDREYAQYAQAAALEGFPGISGLFERIAGIEQIHHGRFARAADLLEQGRLFTEPQESPWVCLHCGYVHFGLSAPETCPVCGRPQGYYTRPRGT